MDLLLKQPLINLETELAKTISENIIKLRTEKNMMQDQLAFEAGVCVKTIQRTERGERVPSLAELILIAEALEVSVERITGRKLSDNVGSNE